MQLFQGKFPLSEKTNGKFIFLLYCKMLFVFNIWDINCGKSMLELYLALESIEWLLNTGSYKSVGIDITILFCCSTILG